MNSEKISVEYSILNKGKKLFETGNIEEAINTIESLINKLPNYAEAYSLLGEIFLKKNNNQKADNLITRSIILFGEERKKLHDILTQEADTNTQNNIKEKIITLNKKISISYLNLGDNFCATNEYNYALKSYQNSYQNNPTSVTICKKIATFFIKQREIEKAISFLNYITELEPNNPNSYLYLAAIYAEANQHEQAIKYANKTLDIDSDFINARFLIFRQYYYIGDFEKCREYGKDIVKKYDGATGVDSIKVSLAIILPQILSSKNEIKKNKKKFF